MVEWAGDSVRDELCEKNQDSSIHPQATVASKHFCQTLTLTR